MLSVVSRRWRGFIFQFVLLKVCYPPNKSTSLYYLLACFSRLQFLPRRSSLGMPWKSQLVKIQCIISTQSDLTWLQYFRACIIKAHRSRAISGKKIESRHRESSRTGCNFAFRIPESGSFFPKPRKSIPGNCRPRSPDARHTKTAFKTSCRSISREWYWKQPKTTTSTPALSTGSRRTVRVLSVSIVKRGCRRRRGIDACVSYAKLS